MLCSVFVVGAVALARSIVLLVAAGRGVGLASRFVGVLRGAVTWFKERSSHHDDHPSDAEFFSTTTTVGRSATATSIRRHRHQSDELHLGDNLDDRAAVEHHSSAVTETFETQFTRVATASVCRGPCRSR